MSNLFFQDLVPGDRVRIIGYKGLDASYRNRLLSMGLTPGTEILVQNVAPLGDPVEIKVRGFSLCIRRPEAASIEVERL